MGRNTWLRSLLAATCAWSLACSAVHAQALNFEVPEGDLKAALDAYARQSGLQLIYRIEDVRGVATRGVRGALPADAALERILAGTGFTVARDAGGAIAIVGHTDRTQGHPVPGMPSDVDGGASSGADSRRAPIVGDAEKASSDVVQMSAVIVTGSNIRGISPDSSPSRTFGREDIEASGVATTQDFIRTMPQNFSGGSNANIAQGLPNQSGSGFNSTFGSSANLRGLGSGSTLVLLDGRRMAPTSTIGDFVDLSMIPLSAVEQVDVLLDGASSIYGADAVAGVVNFILRRDYEGFETSYRYGTVTSGDREENRVSLLGGQSWQSGSAMLSYEYLKQGSLSAAGRGFAAGALLPQDLLPAEERHSVFGNVRQQAGQDLELSAALLYSVREATQDSYAVEGLAYRQKPESENINLTVGGVWKASEDWAIDFHVMRSSISNVLTTTGGLDGESDAKSDLATAFLNASGPLLSLPAGDLSLAIGGQYRAEDFRSGEAVLREADRQVREVFGELHVPVFSPENALPGLQRLEFNLSARHSDFSDFGSSTSPKMGVLWAPIRSLRFRASYGESFKPPALGHVGANDATALVYSTALINELLDQAPADPAIADVVAITVNGTSRDLMPEESTSFTGGLEFDHEWGEHRIRLGLNYFDIKYENRLGHTPVPDNRGSFDIPNIAFLDPDAFPPGTVIFDPTPEQITAAISDLNLAYGSLPAGLDPYDARIIRYNAVTRNLGRVFVEGFDFNISYIRDLEHGRVSAGVDAVWLSKYRSQGAVTSPAVDVLNTLYNPIDLRVRSRLGYSAPRFSANAFVNYIDSYRVDSTPLAARIDSWTTMDLSFSYNTGWPEPGRWLSGLTLGLSIQNLFDQDPPSTPSTPSLQIFGYDPTNATPLNRFVSIEVTKRF